MFGVVCNNGFVEICFGWKMIVNGGVFDIDFSCYVVEVDSVKFVLLYFVFGKI